MNNQSLVFVCAPTAGGKSRLGHILAVQKEALYSYASISPDYFFDSNGLLKKNFFEDPKLIIDKFKKINFLLRGGKIEGRRWMGEDELSFYDFDYFDRKITRYITKNYKEMNLLSFYTNYNKILMESRDRGADSSYSVYELEGVEDYNYFKNLKNKLNKVIVFSIIRNPLQMIPSQKVPSLVRGSQNPSFKGGFLKRGDFDFLVYSRQIQTQYTWLLNQRRKKLNYIIPIDFDKLKNMNINLARIITKKIFSEKEKTEDFSNRLVDWSKKNVFKNNYVYLQPHGTSYYRPDWQSHLKIKINKSNQNEYMYKWELIFPKIFMPIYRYLSLKSNNWSIFESLIILFYYFPYLFLSSLIFGFKEIRSNLNFIDYLKLRYNAFRYVLEAFQWWFSELLIYLFKK